MSTKRPRTRRRGVSQSLSALQAAIILMEELNTCRSLSIAILLRHSMTLKDRKLRNETLVQALSLDFDPLRYDLLIHGQLCFKKLAARVSKDYQATKFLSKLDIDLGIDRKHVAFTRFMKAEEDCGNTNWRFSHSGLVASSKDPTSARWLEISFQAKKKIAEILGKCDLDYVVNAAGFGPGVTLEARNRPILPAKLSTTVVFSPSSWRLLSHIVGASPLFFEATTGIKPDGPCCTYGNQVHEDDHLSFVPKTWKTDRSICIGSSAAIYVQKGIGKLLRRRLLRVGVNLDDQSRNQVLAEKASVGQHMATIDLESASDSISRGLVRFLLPDNWLELLESVRSKWTVLPNGERLFLNKFSAMGNGYTFELESLIFFSLTVAFFEYYGVESSDISVYGDDIVCPSVKNTELFEFFSFCGFRINKEKTFNSGYFRESCGKDFIHGFDVRPFFLKKEIDQLEDFFKLGNQIRAWNLRGDSYRPDDTLRRIYGRLYHCIDPRFRYRVPPSFPGDAGFHSTTPPNEDSRKGIDRGFDGWYFRYSSVKTDAVWSDTAAALGAKLISLSDSVPCGTPAEKVNKLLYPDAALNTGNKFSRRARGLARRASRMGYTFCWT